MISASPAAISTVAVEDRPCPLGCPRDDRFVLVGWDRLSGGPGRFAVVRCGSCGLMRTNPRPTPESIALYYPEDYGPYRGTRVNPSAPDTRIRRRLKWVAHQVFRFNTQRLPSLRAGRLLEIGCASGAFLHQMAAGGWRVEGIEFSQTASQAARRLGYHIHTSSLENARDVAGDFDLIVGWMVLEHLHEPLPALQKLRTWAKPRSYLVLSTPNAGALERKIFGDRWYALQLPSHLFHFTPRTLGKLLESGGWHLERIFHQRVLTNFVGSVGHLIQDRHVLTPVASALTLLPERARLANYLLYPLALPLAAIGQTGRMTAWARRIDD